MTWEGQKMHVLNTVSAVFTLPCIIFIARGAEGRVTAIHRSYLLPVTTQEVWKGLRIEKEGWRERACRVLFTVWKAVHFVEPGGLCHMEALSWMLSYPSVESGSLMTRKSDKKEKSDVIFSPRRPCSRKMACQPDQVIARGSQSWQLKIYSEFIVYDFMLAFPVDKDNFKNR